MDSGKKGAGAVTITALRTIGFGCSCFTNFNNKIVI